MIFCFIMMKQTNKMFCFNGYLFSPLFKKKPHLSVEAGTEKIYPFSDAI
ncbi:MAG: hypothetical protein RL555_1461 [Bacteroidota bacterium]